MIIKAGTILLLEQGEYSDKTWSGPFRTLIDIDQAAAMAEFRQQWQPEGEWDDGPDPDAFIAWLTRSGFIEDVDQAISWHLGSYGCLELPEQLRLSAADPTSPRP